MPRGVLLSLADDDGGRRCGGMVLCSPPATALSDWLRPPVSLDGSRGPVPMRERHFAALFDTPRHPFRRPLAAATPVRIMNAGGFELYLDGGSRALPQRLTLELTRRRPKVRSFWNGCAYVM